MRAGQLRHRITLQQKTTSLFNYGATTETWAALDTVWAGIEALTGREFFSSQQTVAQADYRITLRYRSGITSAMRAVEGTRTFDIQTVLDPDGRRRELVLMVKEVV